MLVPITYRTSTSVLQLVRSALMVNSVSSCVSPSLSLSTTFCQPPQPVFGQFVLRTWNMPVVTTDCMSQETSTSYGRSPVSASTFVSVGNAVGVAVAVVAAEVPIAGLYRKRTSTLYDTVSSPVSVCEVEAWVEPDISAQPKLPVVGQLSLAFL